MKKIFSFSLLVFITILLLGCRSNPGVGEGSQRLQPGSFPEPVRQAILNADDNALVGIGTARLTSASQSRVIATARARAEIARQMNTMVDDMIRDYQASSEVDPQAALSFQENITVTLSRADVSGARAVEIYNDIDGTVWVVVVMDKSNVVREITQAQSAARLAVPAMASFDAEARMNEAFARMNSSEPQVRSED